MVVIVIVVAGIVATVDMAMMVMVEVWHCGECDDGYSGVWEGVWEGGGLPITGMEVVFACDGMMVVVMDLVAMNGLMMWGGS